MVCGFESWAVLLFFTLSSLHNFEGGRFGFHRSIQLCSRTPPDSLCVFLARWNLGTIPLYSWQENVSAFILESAFDLLCRNERLFILHHGNHFPVIHKTHAPLSTGLFPPHSLPFFRIHPAVDFVKLLLEPWWFGHCVLKGGQIKMYNFSYTHNWNRMFPPWLLYNRSIYAQSIILQLWRMHSSPSAYGGDLGD